MRHALRAARQAGLEVDYFFVDVENVAGSQSRALVGQEAIYQRCERCRGLAGHDRALLAMRREMSAIIREVYPAAKQTWYNLGWTMRRGRLIPCASITQFWPKDLEVAEIASSSFSFGGDEPAYYQALPEALSKIPLGKGLAPIISTCFADYPRAGWQDWDPRVTARVVNSYLADPRLPAIVVFPSLLVRSEKVPKRHLIANRHLYAVAWAASRR